MAGAIQDGSRHLRFMHNSNNSATD